MVSKPINFSQRDIIGCDDLRRTDELIPESNVAIETIAGLDLVSIVTGALRRK
jgi:hypothetical protein